MKVFGPLRADIERYYALCGHPALSERAFPTREGRLLTSNKSGDNFRRHVRAAGVPHFRPYDLRHTCASLLLGGGDESNPGKGWSFVEIGEQLGHSPEVCARYYVHVVKNPLYRGMPIEQVIVHAKKVAADERPGDARQDKRRP